MNLEAWLKNTIEKLTYITDTPKLLKSSPHLLELGAGSGAITISIAHERPDWTILAGDNSPAALEIAKENANRLLSKNSKLSFCLSNWFDNIPSQKFSAILR